MEHSLADIDIPPDEKMEDYKKKQLSTFVYTQTRLRYGKTLEVSKATKAVMAL